MKTKIKKEIIPKIKTKEEITPQTEDVETKEPIKTTKQELLVALLLQKAPSCFEMPPRGAMTRSAVEHLAEEILKNV